MQSKVDSVPGSVPGSKLPDSAKTIEFIGISMSPWTEKARWVVDHHQVPYRYREHTIMLGMPALAARLGMKGSEITVPLIIDGDNVVLDSFDIAQYVDQRSGGGLIPEGTLPEIRHLNLLCDHVLDGSRALMMENLLQDPEIQAASLPPFIPGFLRKPLRFMARMGTEYVQKEFDTRRKAPVVYHGEMNHALIGLDTALERAGGRYLIGDKFSLADILGAVAVGGILPAGPMKKRLGTVLTRAWTQDFLVERFGRLIEWRDRIYQDHRGLRGQAR